MLAPPSTPMDLFAVETRRNPHPGYHWAREHDPMWLDPVSEEWVLTRWSDCEAVLRDPKWSSNPEHRPQPPADDATDIRVSMFESGVRTMLFLDPPDHTRLRRLVSKAFTPRRIEQIRAHVVDIADELLAESGLASGATVDMISTLAYPLPVIVICEMLGVPVEDRHQFEGWSSDATRLLDGDIDDETLQRGMLAAMYFINYFNGLFEQRRAEPRDDLLSALLAVEEAGDTLTEEELRSIVLLLFLAGHETTMNLIGNGLFALLTHPDEWQRLCADPDRLAASTVEECLRFDGPVHLTGRIATDDLEIGGRRFPKGSMVTTVLAAANRDPDRFPDPDRFDITRSDNQHLTFSHGIHYCLGAALARLEGQVVFSTLARQFPDLQLAAPADGIEYREHFVLRGLKALPVRA